MLFAAETELGRWTVGCKLGEQVAVREGNGTYYSFGYHRLNQYSEDWAQSVDYLSAGIDGIPEFCTH